MFATSESIYLRAVNTKFSGRTGVYITEILRTVIKRVDSSKVMTLKSPYDWQCKQHAISMANVTGKISSIIFGCLTHRLNPVS